MGDTFEHNMENRDVNAIKTKLALMTDLAAVLDERDPWLLHQIKDKLDHNIDKSMYNNKWGINTEAFDLLFIDLLAFLIGFEKKESDQKKNIYLFTAEPTDMDDINEEDEWMGSIKKLTQNISKNNE